MLIRATGSPRTTGAEREDAKARIKAAEAALVRLEELAAEDWVRNDTVERLRGSYRFRSNRFRARYEGVDEDGVEERSAQFQRLRRELLEAERQAVLALRDPGRARKRFELTIGQPRSRRRCRCAPTSGGELLEADQRRPRPPGCAPCAACAVGSWPSVEEIRWPLDEQVGSVSPWPRA